ncbi:hypothetical protein BFW38_10130 [Terasakiispira papahanaumokuakeensis]|uniref:Uncharacterized protein n=1 Tax=Terasakiispira papahanaumokuakeensis TaxID=197479 RepID=A0A1E2V9Z8_9GAMM|nr:hypothetical protein [Terasakiispira papahanaumokuakeensis]ODC03849.1 hypothetical protein BFW38_10130 [Terasakiispira papahanaumokuakeensis]
MVEHEQLLKFAKDEDDICVMLYIAKIGLSIDWKKSSPNEILYIPEEIFDSVGRDFIGKIGGEQYYGKTILDDELIELLCGEREPSGYSEDYLNTLTEIRKFIEYGLCFKDSHYLAFEGP